MHHYLINELNDFFKNDGNFALSLNQGRPILEIGSGDGRLVTAINTLTGNSKLGNMVIMTDVFGERVGSCRQAHPNNKCVRSSINDLEKMLAD